LRILVDGFQKNDFANLGSYVIHANFPQISTSCCGDDLNQVDVGGSASVSFGNLPASASAFAYNGKLCAGNSSASGMGVSIGLYVDGWAYAIGQITPTVGLDDDNIWLSVESDIQQSLDYGYPSLVGKCLHGVVVGDRCDMTIVT